MKPLFWSRFRNARFLFAAPLAFPPGHFYSPICDPAEAEHIYRDPRSTASPPELPGVDLALENQIKLWESWMPFLAETRVVPVNIPSKRYRTPSLTYDVGDASVYRCMLRHLVPKRLIEVGCGSSSAVALDAFDEFFTARPQVCFIDPYPRRLLSLLKPHDMADVEIITKGVQYVPLTTFDKLEENDILFINSTHVIKTGSDVVCELFEILPRLRSGVVVHFHDVFYPFEYPRDWIAKFNFSWNELFALRAFLIGNRDWEILFFNDYFVRMERNRVRAGCA